MFIVYLCRCEAMLSQQYGGGKWRASIPKIPSTVNIPRYEILTASNTDTDTSTTTTQVTRPQTVTQTDTLPTTTSEASAEKLAESEMEKEATTSSNLQVCNQVCLRQVVQDTVCCCWEFFQYGYNGTANCLIDCL